jgi:hypothetical protein
MTTNLADSSNRNSLSYRMRSKRDRLLREFLLKARGEKRRSCRIVDLGGGAAYWERVGFDWLTMHEFEVVCVNFQEQELTRNSKQAGPVELAVGDACDMVGYADRSFDIVHSNSVIEHVGMWQKMADFASEVRRLAPSYYVQTPYFWFPFDPHFYRVPLIHWLPASLRLKLHRRVKAGWSNPADDVGQAMNLVESNIMLDRSQFRFLFPDAEHRFEFYAGLPKSMIAMRLAGSDETN